VKFPRYVLAGISGVIDASTLEQARAASPSVYGGGLLAFRPAETPAAYVTKMITGLAALDLPNGIGAGLIAKLDTALSKLEDDNPANDGAAINNLEAFINQVEAQAGKAITEEEATDLIAKAQQIIDLLLVS